MLPPDVLPVDYILKGSNSTWRWSKAESLSTPVCCTVSTTHQCFKDLWYAQQQPNTDGALAYELSSSGAVRPSVRPYFSRCPTSPASDHQVSTKSGQRSSSPYLRTRKDHSLFENMARTTAALLAFAAIAGVAIAADDSNIGSRHAVDVNKVRQWSICLLFLLILSWMWYDHWQDRVKVLAEARSSIRSGVQLFLRRRTLSEMSECLRWEYP